VLRPITEIRVDEQDDEAATEPWVVVNEEEIQHKQVQANKSVVINVDSDETDKSLIAAREDDCEKEKREGNAKGVFSNT
ncbi:hypothetical protein HAX54_007939, partial [Datura stramonium]|nr:hypothetical protein [Datura stramonium]